MGDLKLAVSRLAPVGALTLGLGLSMCSPLTAMSQSEQNIALTRSEILQRIRDEIAYYQLSAYYFRGRHAYEKEMDSEHPISLADDMRDPALVATKNMAIYTKKCNVNWFDFNVASAEVSLVNTGDSTTKGDFALTIPLPALPGTSSIGPNLAGSVETVGQTADVLQIRYPGDEAAEAAMESALHPSIPAQGTGSTSDNQPPDAYPDALRCATLRYHQYLRDQNKTPEEKAALEPYNKAVSEDIVRCSTKQSKEIDKALASGDTHAQKYAFDVKAARKTPVTPIADRLLSWRDGLIRFARTSPVCLPPLSGGGAKSLTVKAEFKVIKDVDPSVSFQLVIVNASVANANAQTQDNTIIFNLTPVENPAAPAAPAVKATAKKS